MDLGGLRLTGDRSDADLGEEALESGGRERHQRLRLFGSDEPRVDGALRHEHKGARPGVDPLVAEEDAQLPSMMGRSGMPDLKQLRVLRVVAEAGSFSAAAARINYTQPAGSGANETPMRRTTRASGRRSGSAAAIGRSS